MFDSFRPHRLQHVRLPCPSVSPGVCTNSCPLSWWWCHPAISSSLILSSSCLQSFPASRSFPMSRLFVWSGQSIEASALASVLPMNIQGWFSLELTGLIFLLSKGFSRVFSSTTVHKHQFFGAQPFLLIIYLSNIYWPFALCQDSSSHTNPRRMVLSLPFTLPPQPRGSYSVCSYWILYKMLTQVC